MKELFVIIYGMNASLMGCRTKNLQKKSCLHVSSCSCAQNLIKCEIKPFFWVLILSTLVSILKTSLLIWPTSSERYPPIELIPKSAPVQEYFSNLLYCIWACFFCCCCSDMLPSQQYRLIKYLLNTAGAGTAFWRCIDLIACAWCQNNIRSRKSSALCRYAYVFACVLTFCVSRLLT